MKSLSRLSMTVFSVLLLVVNLPEQVQAEEKIKIAATTSTIASLTESVTGGRADIYTIASPAQNLHFINPTPKDVLKTKKADVFIHGGLDLESWREPLLDAIGKKEFITGERAIDVSKGIVLLETPQSLSRVHGDIHAFGNPHYSIDPEAAKQMVQTIADGLSALYPDQSSFFQGNAEKLKTQLEQKIKDWKNRMSPFAGEPIISYHNSWLYFLERFRLETLDFLEPKPGIPPTPRHMKTVIEKIKEHGVKIIIRQSFNESGTPKKIAAATGAQVVLLFSEPGEIKGDYIALIEHNVSELEKALR